MLFEVEDISCEKCSDKIETAIRAADPTAQVTVKTAEKRVRVEGLLTAEQAMAALAAAGYPASEAPPHSGEGSDCCGGCS
ncbi:heavy-metal-associated domain-containing protein [Novilysobacter arseniciresistens]|uniref:heavy-metal-associated domain-containing protein n=1 Tax=Novilysobacter arseniciresistens TaxID=1385522 RepID=UPI00068F0900|nr:cation transporter [Lysobacter arseniciresistens]